MTDSYERKQVIYKTVINKLRLGKHIVSTNGSTLSKSFCNLFTLVTFEILEIWRAISHKPFF